MPCYQNASRLKISSEPGEVIHKPAGCLGNASSHRVLVGGPPLIVIGFTELENRENISRFSRVDNL